MKFWAWLVVAGILVDILAYIIHMNTGFPLKSNQLPTIFILLTPAILFLGNKYGWFTSQSTYKISELLHERFEVLRIRMGVVEASISSTASEEVGASFIGSEVRITDGAFGKLSEHGIDFLMAHELAHIVLKQHGEKDKIPVAVYPFTFTLMSFFILMRFDIPWYWHLVAFALFVAFMGLLIQMRPKSIWRGYYAELACDYIAAFAIKDSAGAIEVLHAMKHGSALDRRFAGYPSKEERLEQITSMIAGNERTPFEDSLLEKAVQAILADLGKKPNF